MEGVSPSPRSASTCFGLAAAVMIVCCAPAPPEGPGAKALTVCAVPNAMPRTGRAADGTPQGLDVAVAQLVARKLGRPVAFHWCASAACGWNCLPEGRCDVVVGQPIDSG